MKVDLDTLEDVGCAHSLTHSPQVCAARPAMGGGGGGGK